MKFLRKLEFKLIEPLYNFFIPQTLRKLVFEQINPKTENTPFQTFTFNHKINDQGISNSQLTHMSITNPYFVQIHFPRPKPPLKRSIFPGLQCVTIHSHQSTHLQTLKALQMHCPKIHSISIKANFYDPVIPNLFTLKI